MPGQPRPRSNYDKWLDNMTGASGQEEPFHLPQHNLKPGQGFLAEPTNRQKQLREVKFVVFHLWTSMRWERTTLFWHFIVD